MLGSLESAIRVTGTGDLIGAAVSLVWKTPKKVTESLPLPLGEENYSTYPGAGAGFPCQEMQCGDRQRPEERRVYVNEKGDLVV